MNHESAKTCEILYIVGGFSIGGTERHLSSVLPEIYNSNKNIKVCALGVDGPMSSKIKDKKIPIEFISSKCNLNTPKIRGVINLLSKSLQIIKIIRKERPKVVHCFLSEPAIIGLIAYVLSGKKFLFVISKRSQLMRPNAFPGDQILERMALRIADYVLAHSHEVLMEMSSYGIPNKRLRLIHNGIDLENPNFFNRNVIRKENNWKKDTIVFLTIANLIPYKGHEFLFQALERFNQLYRGDWVLVCVGGDEKSYYGRSLQDVVREKGLDKKIIFAGQMLDPMEYLVAADIGILVGDHEGFSNSILEYMACQMPVVATDVGGNKDAVIEGISGWLIPPRNVAVLTQRLLECTNVQIRQNFGINSFKIYRDQFTLSACIKKYNNFYELLLLDKVACEEQ